jgi:branched-chain amino acid transport system permease protein
VQANLALAIYGVVLIGVMLAAPGGIQGALGALSGLLRGSREPRSRGPVPRAKEEERS